MSNKGPERPRIVANFAMTADGKISTRNHTPSLFTSPADKRRLLEIRADCDAVLAGRGTVAADTMSMGLADAVLQAERVSRRKPPVPLRVLLTNAGRLDPKWKVFRYRESPLVVFSGRRMPESVRGRVAPFCDLHIFDSDEVPVEAMLAILRRDYRIRRLVCEGGATLFRTLAGRGLVDEIFLTVAPVIFGGAGAPTLTGRPGDFFPEAVEFRIAKMDVRDGECFLHLKRR
ncbi:MAG: RibD family protein [Terrimicrobiaceae bacterium]|nr:RibD family protein [Terrimicrobiaceae bacterium]